MSQPTALPTIALLCGGTSVEHEISLCSARHVAAHVDRTRYHLILIGIDRQGKWWYSAGADCIVQHSDQPLPALDLRQATPAVFLPGEQGKLVASKTGKHLAQVTAVIPMLHGCMGEDGTVQGLLELAQVPYVGANVLGTALAMDKAVAKRLLRAEGLPVGDWLTLHAHEDWPSYETVKQRLGTPCFIKPANGGSSLGTHQVQDKATFVQALEDAFQYDSKVIIEAYLPGREIECAVLGLRSHYKTSLPGEIILKSGFYTYSAKYINPEAVQLQVPAQLPAATVASLRSLASQACAALCCEGMARVDFFLEPGEKIYINEVNTLPGFTPHSLYPRMWAHAGYPIAALLQLLIENALAQHQRQQQHRTAHTPWNKTLLREKASHLLP